MKKISVLFAALFMSLVSTSGFAATYDFSTLTSGTSVTTQYAGVSFSLAGGVSSGTPTVANGGIANSTTTDYPTADQLIATFDYAVENVSFNFENYGNNSSYGGTIWQAFDASNSLLGSGSLASAAGELTSLLSLTGITSLILDNNLTGRDSWIFALETLSFDKASVSAVPVPAAIWFMGSGLLGLAGFNRKNKKLAA